MSESIVCRDARSLRPVQSSILSNYSHMDRNRFIGLLLDWTRFYWTGRKDLASLQTNVLSVAKNIIPLCIIRYNALNKR
jgi:hypothetical protein